MKKHQTNKLFYNTWPYKITCQIHGISRMRGVIHNKNFQTIPIKYSIDKYLMRYDLRFDSRFTINVKELTNFVETAAEFLINKEIRKRIESNKINFYVKTKEDYISIKNKLKKYIKEVWEPNNETELETLLDNKKLILCDKLPRKEYKFKVLFKELPLEARKNLVAWAEKYKNNEIYINPRTLLHFQGKKNKYNNYFCYVKEEKTLLFLQLAAANYVKSTFEYVIRNNH